MHLNVIRPLGYVGGELRRNVPCSHGIDRQTHGQQSVRISSEHLPVKKVAPSADNLPHQQPVHRRIQDLRQVQLLYRAIYIGRQDPADDAAVDGKASRAKIENLREIVFVRVPEENHIINSGSDDAEYNEPEGNVPIGFLRLPCSPGNARRRQDAKKHSQCDHASIKRHPKAADVKRLRHIAQIDSQIRECNVHFSHLFCHFPSLRLSMPPPAGNLYASPAVFSSRIR